MDASPPNAPEPPDPPPSSPPTTPLAPPPPLGVGGPRSVPAALGALFAPAALCLLLGLLFGLDRAGVFVMFLVPLGALFAGIWAGRQLSSHFAQHPQRGWIQAALILGCIAASFVAGFVGCLATLAVSR